MGIFGAYAAVYDLLNKDKKYSNETKQIDSLIKKYSNEKSILMLGCGTGMHDRELARLGYRVHGIDLSADMIAIAKEKADHPNLSYETADIRTYQSSKSYPIITALFHVISYQVNNTDLLHTFETVSKLLTSNGVFLFDVWYGPGVLRDLPSVRVKRAENEELKVIRTAEPTFYPVENRVDVHYEISVLQKMNRSYQQFNETHSMRYFFTPEIQFYLKQCHMELSVCLDCKTLNTPNVTSWTAYFIARKC